MTPCRKRSSVFEEEVTAFEEEVNLIPSVSERKKYSPKDSWKKGVTHT